MGGGEEIHSEIAGQVNDTLVNSNTIDFITCKIGSPISKRKKNKENQEFFTPTDCKPGWLHSQLSKMPAVIVVFLSPTETINKETFSQVNIKN